jgi:cell division protein FtsI (penicillin-binding protein 3)
MRRPKRPVRIGAAPRRQRRLRVPRLGNPTRRLRFALSVVLTLFAVLAGRLVQIQAYEGTAYAAQAAADKTRSVVLLAPRGAIVDRHGNELALSVDAVFVDGDPTKIREPAKVARALSGLIGVPESELVRKLSKKVNSEGGPIQFVYLARQRDPQVGQAVLAANLPGIYVRKEQRRDVPGADLAANIVGFVGAEGKGLAGIEASYDSVLRGKDGLRSYARGLHGQQIPDGKDVMVPAKPGHDVQLTIDWDLQYQAQKLLGLRMKDMRGGTGAVVVQDVQTGEIMAMASYPSYDAKDPGDSTAKTRTDLAPGAVIEPGSVHKVVTIGAALEEGKIHAGDTFPIGMTVEKGKVTFKDTHPHPHMNITLQGILAQSSNVGTIAIADKLGPQKLYEYQRAFGLGSKIGIGLPGESGGLVQPPKNWSGPSYGSIPIGLGVAVTPLQMTSVYTTIANDGVRIPPKLVRATIDAKGTSSPTPSAKPQRVMSVENARILRSALEAVPTKFGTAKLAAIPNYRVAGKTGTGLRVENDHYMPGNVASFVGIFPADAPRYVVGVFVHAGPGSSGGAVAAPLFSELGKFTLQLYAIPPTGTAPPPIRISVP